MKQTSLSGFSLVELVVVLFILSIMAFFTIPLFKAPEHKAIGSAAQGKLLAHFIESVKLKAVRDQLDYTLHLDLLAETAWAAPIKQDNADQETLAQTDGSAAPGERIDGVSISRVDLAGNTRQDDLDNIEIRIFKEGVCDMALIHMETLDGEITLKLEPFIHEVAIYQEDISFDDCL